MKIRIINGPNLNLLGRREEHFYGAESFEKIFGWLEEQFPKLELEYFQSNHEGEIIDKIQEAMDSNVRGLIINAGAFSHYSYAIYDALLALKAPKIEVHLSNICSRESFRQKSVISAACDGLITGLGKYSYFLACEWFQHNQPGKIGFHS